MIQPRKVDEIKQKDEQQNIYETFIAIPTQRRAAFKPVKKVKV
jgi:hypothetical protein